MIDFPCHCGHQFSVGEDLAGSVIQCPQCKRLNDVPLLSDLQNIDERGIYKLDTPPRLKDDPKRLAQLTYVFTRAHYDADGNPIDLRQTTADAHRLSGKPMPVESLPPGPSATPKYDPVTGELIRELEVKPDVRPDSGALPVARIAPLPPKAVVDGMDMPGPLEIFVIPLRLLRPINLLVMFFIFLGHLAAQAMMTAIMALNLILVPFWFVLHCLILAHFGNVIDETGPTSRSELPTPLRGLSWHDDTFGPFARIIAAVVVCYGPTLFVLLNFTTAVAPVVLSLAAALAIIGTILFPAAVLTTTTSGSLLNLRPDRIVGVAVACGAEYILAVIIWVIGGATWLAGTSAINLMAASVMRPKAWPPFVNVYTAYGALALGIFILHFFCWHLGTLYRKHHQRFPWLFQRHVAKHGPQAPMSGFPVVPSTSDSASDRPNA